jgi:hypothetical protein
MCFVLSWSACLLLPFSDISSLRALLPGEKLLSKERMQKNISLSFRLSVFCVYRCEQETAARAETKTMHADEKRAHTTSNITQLPGDILVDATRGINIYSSSSIIAQHTDLTWILRRRCFVYIILFLSLLSTGARWRACKKNEILRKVL